MATFYHWTARRFVPAIRVQGLCMGAITVSIKPGRFLTPYQWLTSNGGPSQDWADGTGRLPYRRDEVRLTVEIPEPFMDRVLDREQWQALMEPETAATMVSYGDPDNWYVFRGRIPRQWITKAVAKTDLR